MKKATPRILHWDVETSYMKVYTFGLFKQDISIGNIVDDWFMICAAWQWDDEKKAHCTSVLDDKKRFKANHKDDFHVISELHAVLQDSVCACLTVLAVSDAALLSACFVSKACSSLASL